MIKTVFIVGPTASGKTSLSIEIAKKYGGEIISADSMQIYKGIHIASAAPDNEEMQCVPHHLLEFLSLDEQYSVADYVLKARECIKEIASRGKLPIVVGGTGLYVSSLLDNTEFIKSDVDESLRKSLEDRFDNIGAEKMLEELSKFDSDTAKRLHPNNRRRIIRAFEVYSLTGKTVTEQNLLSHRDNGFIESLIIGINYKDREKLYERINKRIDIMLENGLLDEAKTTFKGENKKGAFQAIGHKELYGYLDGSFSLEEATKLLKQQTRRYAKRQITWFKRDERINWINADECQNTVCEAIKLIENFIGG